jgi:membrane-bound ClpP family serine protease
MTWNRLLLAAMAAVIVYLSYGLYEEKYRDRGRLAVIARGDHVVLVWGTRVDVPMRTRFQEAFDKWRERTDRFVIQLHSPGGSLREGRELIELIEQSSVPTASIRSSPAAISARPCACRSTCRASHGWRAAMRVSCSTSPTGWAVPS